MYWRSRKISRNRQHKKASADQKVFSGDFGALKKEPLPEERP